MRRNIRIYKLFGVNVIDDQSLLWYKYRALNTHTFRHIRLGPIEGAVWEAWRPNPGEIK